MILVDPPDWPGHGRWWSHLVSDVSLDELHAFAAELGAPAKGFERDRPQPRGGWEVPPSTSRRPGTNGRWRWARCRWAARSWWPG
ncbi:hypothetical protein KSE_44140 [Kitasatospora setae KM-6054]|uniref:DUF4031 domain-containing protein n=1 Tax=Kitasatospora setae (strain ATCC 33774 / DSM 43861 / JCM 3304 / KCC A-0304 / NBRC 14216 / KM-6054) TaxID=452652 RepID=E4NFB7_KITSK|nr:hypothetical protein KSE_44140 [Kitasatospora setae KM-6054]